MTPTAALGRLKRAFPEREITMDDVRFYEEELADVPGPVLEEAVKALVRTCRWFPKLAEIREACAEVLLKLPSESAAIEQARARQAWAAELRVDREIPPPPAHPLVLRALSTVGGARALAEPSTFDRFTRVYRGLRADELRGCQMRALPS